MLTSASSSPPIKLTNYNAATFSYVPNQTLLNQLAVYNTPISATGLIQTGGIYTNTLVTVPTMVSKPIELPALVMNSLYIITDVGVNIKLPFPYIDGVQTQFRTINNVTAVLICPTNYSIYPIGTSSPVSYFRITANQSCKLTTLNNNYYIM